MTALRTGALTIRVSVDLRGGRSLDGSSSETYIPLNQLYGQLSRIHSYAHNARLSQIHIEEIRSTSREFRRIVRGIHGSSLTLLVRRRLLAFGDSKQRGIVRRIALIASAKLRRWEEERSHSILDALRITQPDDVSILEAWTGSFADSVVNIDTSSGRLCLTWDAWDDWTLFVALAQFAGLLRPTRWPVPQGLGIIKQWRGSDEGLVHKGFVKERGQMELSLRIEVTEPGEPVTLDASVHYLEELLNLWNHCADVVDKVRQDSIALNAKPDGQPKEPTEPQAPETAPASSEIAPIASSDITAPTGEVPDHSEVWVFPLPNVRLIEGSLIVELIQDGNNWWGIQTMALIAFTLRTGPSLAGLPHNIRERWYSSASSAERAKRSLEMLRPELTTKKNAAIGQEESRTPMARSWKRLGRGSS